MLEKIKNDELLGHKVGILLGILMGLLAALFVSSKADEYPLEEEYLEEVDNEEPTE